MTNIHPTAQIDSDAKLGEGVEIGPFVVVSADVVLGDGCRVQGHAQLLPGVTLGADCEVGYGAVIGGDPQDFKFDRETKSGVEIGAGTILREHVTVHRGSREGSMTRIGERNFLMVGVHIGHDVQMGDHNVLANNCLIAGEVQIGQRNFFGGGSAFHQFIRVGDLVMVKGVVGVSQDVPPFVIVSELNEVRGLNVVGMKRAGFGKEQLLDVKAAFNHVYRDGMNLSQALASAQPMEWGAEAAQFLEFFREESKKGVCRLR